MRNSMPVRPLSSKTTVTARHRGTNFTRSVTLFWRATASPKHHSDPQGRSSAGRQRRCYLLCFRPSPEPPLLSDRRPHGHDIAHPSRIVVNAFIALLGAPRSLGACTPHPDGRPAPLWAVRSTTASPPGHRVGGAGCNTGFARLEAGEAELVKSMNSGATISA